jgi:hypothetical protein
VKFLAVSLLLISNAFAAAIITDGVVQGGGNAIVQSKNYVANPFAQKNVSNWTATNVTATRITSAGNKLNGVSSFNLSSATNGGTFVSAAMATQDDLVGNCEASVMFKASSGSSANYTFYIDNGSGTVLASVVLTNESAWKPARINYPCATGYKLGISHQGTATDVIQVGNFYWGSATNVGSVAQAQLVGTITWAATASCNWNHTSASYAGFAADTDCPTPTVTGAVTAPGTKIPAAVLSSLSAGDYMFKAIGSFQGVDSSTNNPRVAFRFHDGTVAAKGDTMVGTNATAATNTQAYGGVVEGLFSYTTAQSNVTVNIQSILISGTNTNINVQAIPLTILIYRFPTSSEIAVRADQTAQSWSGYISGVSGGFSMTSATQTDFSNGTGSPVITTLQSTNFTAPTLASGPKPGITFTPPAQKTYQICASVPAFNTTADNYFLYLIDGASVVQDYTAHTNASANFQSTFKLCGHFSGGPSSAITAKIQGSSTAGSLSIPSNTNPRVVHWTITDITQSTPAPLLVGSVTSNSTGLERVERATIANSGSASITSQSGSWISSVNRSGVGVVDITIASGTFSATPVCSVLGNNSSGQAWTSSAGSSTAIQVTTANTSGAATDKGFYIICMGPR